MVHIFLHLLLPAIVAFLWYKKTWLKSWLIMMVTMVVDLDHLLAVPIYDPNRCSIGFHPLHSYYAIAVYVVLLFFPKTRLVGVGLAIHMLLDYSNCIL